MPGGDGGEAVRHAADDGRGRCRVEAVNLDGDGRGRCRVEAVNLGGGWRLPGNLGECEGAEICREQCVTCITRSRRRRHRRRRRDSSWIIPAFAGIFIRTNEGGREQGE